MNNFEIRDNPLLSVGTTGFMYMRRENPFTSPHPCNALFLGTELLTVSPRSRSDSKDFLVTSFKLKTMIYLYIVDQHKVSTCTRFEDKKRYRYAFNTDMHLTLID